MRRILLALAVLMGSFASVAPAHAGWGWHRGCGWGGGWSVGYRGCGWGGWGYRGCGWGGCGPWYGGYGVSLGCYRPIVTCYSPSWGCANGYYAPLPIGYYGYYGSTYNPNSNFVALSVSSNVVARPATMPAVAPTSVRNLLDLSREDLLAMLRTPSGSPVAAATPERPTVRITNAEQRRKAEQYLAVGDVLFREQKFHSALQRYKLASQTAPDMAETYWRQGHAMIATANYELAGSAFKRALALDPTIGRGGFTLDELYGTAAMAKSSHMESLAGWALSRGDTSEPYFLMGVQLYYDRQHDRANKFFARASELSGPAGGYLVAFAPPRVVPGRAVPAAAPAKVEADAGPPLPFEPAAAPIVERKAAPAVPVSAVVEI